MKHRNLLFIAVPLASLAACADETGEVSDDVTAAFSYVCAVDDSCLHETDGQDSLGYCVTSVDFAKATGKRAAITIGRYSSVADEDYSPLRARVSRVVSKANDRIAGDWSSRASSISATFDEDTRDYRGELVINGAAFDVHCVSAKNDPCARAAQDGSYCGDSLTPDLGKASTLFQCQGGATVDSTACNTCSGPIVDGAVGEDRCSD